jgi:VWFA-related protein
MIRKSGLALVAFAFLPLLAAQQKSEQPSADAPAVTIHTTTRLVQVDVVVTDKAGNPITGLKESDFTVLQDGKPQPVRAFEAHVLTPEARKTRVVPTLPPNTYTNLPESIQDQSWTIVVYDVLNTPTQNQQDARNQLLQLLRSLPPGRPVALFLLAQRFEMLEGFSNDPKTLVAAAEKLNPNTSALLTTEGERQNVVGETIYTSAMATPGGASGHSLKAGKVQRELQQYYDQEASRAQQRTLFTMDAMKAMARAVSGYPGRKNLIWLSGSFPIRLESSQDALDPFRNSTTYLEKLVQTGTLLTASRIAVYPIDVRGLQTTGIDITVVSAAGGEAFVGGRDLTGATSQGIAGTSNDATAALLRDQSSTLSNERETMTEAAYQTGGRAFFTNDFAAAMQKAMDDGSRYYTIAFTPPDQKEKADPYHRIEVKLDQPNVNLSYRRGYYASPQQATAEQGTAALQGALQPGMPPATMLYVMASVQPLKGKQKTVKINYIISPNNVTFSDLPENKKHVVVDCMAIAFDKDGKEVAHASDTLDGAIPQAAYDAVMKQGLPANQEIELKPGTYNLRLGVMDRTTQQIGTVDVPLEIREQIAAK